MCAHMCVCVSQCLFLCVVADVAVVFVVFVVFVVIVVFVVVIVVAGYLYQDKGCEPNNKVIGLLQTCTHNTSIAWGIPCLYKCLTWPCHSCFPPFAWSRFLSQVSCESPIGNGHPAVHVNVTLNAPCS